MKAGTLRNLSQRQSAVGRFERGKDLACAIDGRHPNQYRGGCVVGGNGMAGAGASRAR